MQPHLLNPPKTLEEVYRMLPEGTLAELINDQLYMSPAPSLSHQELILELATQIKSLLKKTKNGHVFIAPVDLFINSKNIFQPDIVFVSAANKSMLKEDGIYGTPDLIIEVISPGSRKLDLEKKKKAYEKAGVKEYWAVDPASRNAIGFELKKGAFTSLKEEQGKLSSSLLKHTFKF
jgi:Uma2 family endonuclease